jgi:hypothetical protein
MAMASPLAISICMVIHQMVYIDNIFFPSFLFCNCKFELMDLERVSQVDAWCNAVYKLLIKSTSKFMSYNKWLKLISRYYIDVFNTELKATEILDEAYDVLVWKSSKKLELTIDAVEEAFNIAKITVNKRTPLLQTYELTKRIPLSIQDTLIKQAGQEEFIKLATRYYVLGYTDGLFLSIDISIYTALISSSRLPVLECYASPFNHTSNTYCSLFDQDKLFGALPRFDHFIDNVNFPCRLILNPPFSNQCIATCIDKLIAYMKRCRGEFIAMLPLMFNYQPIDELLAHGCTRYVLLEPGTHSVYNFLSNTDILIPMSMYIICNIGGCAFKSHNMANNIAYHLRVKAELIMQI